MTFCAGIDNSQVVPPFLPYGRGQDGVFGTMLALADVSAVSGHVPVGIVHDSDRGQYPPGIVSASRTTVSGLSRALLAVMPQIPPGGDPSAAIRHIGQYFRQLAGAQPATFSEAVISALAFQRGQELSHIESQLQHPVPLFWRTALTRYREVLRAAMRTPAFWVPRDLPAAGSSTMESTREFYDHFGELCEAWPDLWNVARSSLAESPAWNAAVSP